MINKERITIVAHDGTFHTDDVCAVAILCLVFKDKQLEIIRTRDEEKIESADIAVDIGGIYDPSIYRFDHHQREGAGVRENGVPYASAGLVWNTFGPILCGGNTEMVKNIDMFIIQGVDGPDNGYDMYENPSENNPRYYNYSIKDFVINYRPTGLEDIRMDDAFLEAVETMKKILTRAIAHSTFYFYGKQKLEQAYQGRTSDYYIVTDAEYSGWYEFAESHPDLLYMIYPRTTKGWSAKSALKEMGSFEPRKAFPESWRGLKDDELAQLAGVEGARFCHRSGYMVTADTEEHILQLVKIAVES
jgi:uncharacterized UPF0160 family protein